MLFRVIDALPPSVTKWTKVANIPTVHSPDFFAIPEHFVAGNGAGIGVSIFSGSEDAANVACGS